MISPDQYPKFRLFTLSITGLLSLLLLISPLSLFSQDSSPPSPDFDGNGTVDIPDFLVFVDVFGSKEGEEKYDAKYDLDGDGEIGIPDFLIFVDNFGKAVTRDELTATVPSNVVVENGDSKLTVRWDAVPDEEGKPSVTGYEVGYRERDADDSVEWAVGEPTSSRLDTSVTITGLLNGQAYQVSVRTLVDGGGSEWPSPVLGIPVRSAAGPVFIGGGGGGGTPPTQNNLIPSAPTSFRHECGVPTTCSFYWRPPTRGLPLLRYEFYTMGLWINLVENESLFTVPEGFPREGDFVFQAFFGHTTNGTFTFRVRAVNEHGTGPEASLTMTITPEDE